MPGCETAAFDGAIASGVAVLGADPQSQAPALMLSWRSGHPHARSCCSRVGRAAALSAASARALASPGRSGSTRSVPPLAQGHSAQSLSPALADIIGARRVRTAAMISSGPMPWR